MKKDIIAEKNELLVKGLRLFADLAKGNSVLLPASIVDAISGDELEVELVDMKPISTSLVIRYIADMVEV